MFFLDEANVASGILYPNSIIVNVIVKTPGTPVINQNFDDRWHTNKGTLTSVDGLLAVRLAGVGADEVTLRYRPLMFYIGLLSSVLSFAIFAVFCLTYVRRRGVPFSISVSAPSRSRDG